jgi:hypothetical protein
MCLRMTLKHVNVKYLFLIPLVSAFVALGGKPDRTGYLKTEILQESFKNFGLTNGIEALIREVGR